MAFDAKRPVASAPQVPPTPCTGFVGGLAPIIIGFLAGAICFLAIQLKFKFGYDDSLDVVGVHMVGGMLGVVLTGAFTSLAINPAGAAASLTQVGRQAVLAAVTVAFSFAMSMVLLKVTDVVVGLRVKPEDEEAGLNISQHAEVAYGRVEEPIAVQDQP